LFENPTDLIRVTDIGLNQKTVRSVPTDFRKGCFGSTFVLLKSEQLHGLPFRLTSERCPCRFPANFL
jgi:hypothetical protein